MKRYILFGGDFFYPHRSKENLIDDFDNIEDAISYATSEIDKYNIEWYDILDIQTGEWVSVGNAYH